MAVTDSAVAIDESAVIVGDGLSGTATAISDAVGLSGYTINIIGDGTLNASALSNSSGSASSGAGIASS